MVLYVLDQSFNIVVSIDDYESLIWRPSYSDIGDFELYIRATRDKIASLKKDYYLVRDIDISIESGAVTYDKVMIIKNFKLTTDIDEGDHYIVTGRELKYILHQRIIWSQTNLSGTAEAGIRQLVTENAISPTDTKRQIPNLVLGASAGLTDKLVKQITGDYLDKAIIDICTSYKYGWDIFIHNGKMVLIVYTGVDRSYNQTVRPYVVFSEDFDNILNSEYEAKSETYANTTLIGGEGEGAERTYTTVGNDNSGLNRFELFTDAKDLSSNKGSDTEIPQATYITLLQERGADKLAELAITEAFTGDLLTDGNFKYGTDFYLGDKVTVINRYGISKDVIVLSAIESDDENGLKLIPQFNI